jgi:hypothetical protein
MTQVSGKDPWHQRFAPVRWLRGALRNAFYRFLTRALQTEDGKSILAESLDGLSPRSPGLCKEDLNITPPPYPELWSTSKPPASSRRNNTIFITARFRSGSTLLWNLFRNLEGFTSYYEPFNERRWFDPSTRGRRMDGTHRNVSDYWKEYDRLSVLGDYYQKDWICRRLFMDSNVWDSDMKKFIDVLIDHAPGRAVLQFNRVDFRLPWLRQHFPTAKIIHLYRHPRDQWCSSLMDLKCCPRDGTISQFGHHDKFYLLMWVTNLKYHFPFLDPRRATHPYQLFYYLWKLSYLFGRKYAHYSLSFEDLVRHPDLQLRQLFQVLDIVDDSLDPLKTLISAPPLGKWKDYADDDWFQKQEATCEAVLAEWFMGLGSSDRDMTVNPGPEDLEGGADSLMNPGSIVRSLLRSGGEGGMPPGGGIECFFDPEGATCR